MIKPRKDVRLALPSKGRLAEEAQRLLSEAGLTVRKTNPRQFEATIPTLPGLKVLFQRAGDIPVSVRDGSVDFGITGWDSVVEKTGEVVDVLPLHQQLGFGHCRLCVLVPEAWDDVTDMETLAARCSTEDASLRVATKFPRLTREFFAQHGFADTRLIQLEGTLEVAPTMGYADVIVDLVSTGITARDNRLKLIDGGLVLEAQATLIANRQSLERGPQRKQALTIAHDLLEYIEAHLRAAEHVAVFVNIRGDSPEAIYARIKEKTVIGGLQGPTISPVMGNRDESWFAAHVVVRRRLLGDAIAELRAIGGSGVVVTPVTYIFEEEPPAYQRMLAALATKESE